MKDVKIMFIAVEVAALIGVFMLAFSNNLDEEGEFFKSVYIVLCAILAVVMQKEQQAIDWEDNYEEK